MKLDHFVKDKDHIHICPFCSEKLLNTYKSVKYFSCVKCVIPDVKGNDDNPYSKYHRTVMKEVDIGNGKVCSQTIINETFFIHYTENKWYNVNNSLIKNQTTIVLTRPFSIEDIVYEDEIALVGMIWIGKLVLLPFIDSWNLADQEATLSKIKTYLLFQ